MECTQSPQQKLQYVVTSSLLGKQYSIIFGSCKRTSFKMRLYMHTDGQAYGRNDNWRHEKRAPSCQKQQAQGFALKYHASRRELSTSVSTSYHLKTMTLEVLRSCGGKYNNHGLLGWRHGLVHKYRRFRRTCCHLPIQTTWQHITQDRTH